MKGMVPKDSISTWYPTPDWVAKALIVRERFPERIWEPACGDGAISKHLPFSTVATDLYDYGYGIPGIDFLNLKTCGSDISAIITNPPYELVPRFLSKALSFQSVSKIAFFLKLNFLENHQDMWDKWPLSRLWIFSRNPQIDPRNEYMYGWFIWEKGFEGNPELHWIP